MQLVAHLSTLAAEIVVSSLMRLHHQKMTFAVQVMLVTRVAGGFIHPAAAWDLSVRHAEMHEEQQLDGVGLMPYLSSSSSLRLPLRLKSTVSIRAAGRKYFLATAAGPLRRWGCFVLQQTCMFTCIDLLLPLSD